MTPMLEQFASVRGRFHRSISLAADWAGAEAMNEYVATETVVELAGGIIEELDNDFGARAWSITGPYGSGKSAFGLFLCDVMANASPSHRVAASLRRRFKLGSRRFLPVLVGAERGPLAPLLLKALGRRSSGARSSASDAEAVVRALGEAATVARRRRYSGLVVVVDELGKFLEYAALRPQDADVFLLQQLAEAATRCPIPIVLVTILHSGFADYLPATEEVRRSEWQKVQGRYRDVPFQLPAEQVLQLVASALDTRFPDDLKSAWNSDLGRVLNALPSQRQSANQKQLLASCFPLHPVTSLLIWPLFRSKGAQNERSLFSFLTSREPHGLREYMANTVCDGAAGLYRPAHLFDYIAVSLGLGAFRGDQARRWALADHALASLPADAPAACADVIKTTALVGLYGAQVGISASFELLAHSIGSKSATEKACEYLSRKSLVVFRRHSSSYALWEGSDFDLEAAHERALLRTRATGSLAQRLQAVLQLRPFVPRGHYIRTGTMRWFDVGLASTSEELRAFAANVVGDGKVAFVLSDDTGEPPAAFDAVAREAGDAGVPVVLAFPEDAAGVEQAVGDLEAWMWVANYSLELAGDAVARQEVRARVAAARDRLESLVGATLGLPGFVLAPSRSRWRHAGKAVRLSSAVQFQQWLSDLCDERFSASPTFRNELLNRSALSSAAAAARRTLIQRMLENGTQERLGIEGWPPEASMYEAMLRSSGLHRSHASGWSFGRPDGAWAPAWDASVAFAKAAGSSRRSIAELFDFLKSPPLGLRDGPLPVLLCAVLVFLGDEVALYEDGVFVPELRIEVFERLLRRPESFALKYQALSGSQMKTVRALGQALADSSPGGKPLGARTATVALVRKLVVSVAGMPPYARQTRRRLSPEAIRVREQLLTASDPTALLFEDLPTACGVALSSRSVTEFVSTLTTCMGEITGAYAGLLDEIETMVRSAFGLSTDLAVAERQLRQIAEPLIPIASEPRLQVFVREAARDFAGRDWREAMGRAINGGLPPTHWKDADAAAFQLRLAELRGEVARLQGLAAEMRRTGAPRVVRLGLLEASGHEIGEVVALNASSDAELESLVRGVSAALWRSKEDSADARRLRLEALGRVAAELLVDHSQEVRS